MIKLQNSLPNTIEVEGREFLVKTDFRYWLVFDEIIRNGDEVKITDLAFLFEDEMPMCDFSKELIEFFVNPNSTPRGSGSENVIDYQEDGEYIYASFLNAYGIDLLYDNLHWHQFKALVLGLPDDTIMGHIMSMRGWKKDNRKFDKIQQDNKRAWALPKRNKKQEEELEEYLDKIFYNA